MRKLTLRLEDLAVDGFSTTPAETQRGTVNGHSHWTWCTCPGQPTCDATCLNTCPETCDDWSCAETCGFSNCETRCGPAATCRCPDYPEYP